jgi:polyferredoxin
LSKSTQAAETLYESAPKIYPREIDGRFARLRVAAVWVLLGLYYGIVWLRWDGRQAVLFDLPARQVPHLRPDLLAAGLPLPGLLLIMAALSLFFFTALAGRLWCGYACPQTVWTEAFLWMERMDGGQPPAAHEARQGPWNREKMLRKG